MKKRLLSRNWSNFKNLHQLYKVTLVACCFSFWFPNPSSAQDTATEADSLSISTEAVAKPRPILDTLSFRLIGDGSFSRGNIDRTLAVLRAEVAASGPAIGLTINPRFTFGKQNGLLAERDGYLDLFIDVFKKERTYFFALGILENSNLRKIHFRQNGGIGIGFRILKNNPEQQLTITNALLYESTDFFERSKVETIRNSMRIRGRHTLAKLKFDHTTFLQPSLTDIRNFRWSTVLAVEVPMSKWFSLRSAFENSFESVVEANRKRNDYRLTVGFVIGTK